LVALVVLGAITFGAVAASLVAPANPLTVSLVHRLAPVSGHHLLGTDEVGRDVLSRLLFGARWTLGGALLVSAVSVTFGVVVGSISGYLGGAVDAALMRLVDVLLAFPALLLALAIVGVAGPGLQGVLFALSAAGWAGYARVTRGLVLGLREREFVAAARVCGAGGVRVFGRHLLPNVVSPILVLATLEMGQLILALAGLSFLGLGVQPPTPEWGSMLNAGRAYIFNDPQLMIYPGVAITIVVLCFNVVGEHVSDNLDPRLAAGGSWRLVPRRHSWSRGATEPGGT
jgi:peptide/nickel transport system permease protein